MLGIKPKTLDMVGKVFTTVISLLLPLKRVRHESKLKFKGFYVVFMCLGFGPVSETRFLYVALDSQGPSASPSQMLGLKVNVTMHGFTLGCACVRCSPGTRVFDRPGTH